MTTAQSHVLIVGAGFTGLAAAIELQNLGVRITLCERNNQVGGLSNSRLLNGLNCELGPHIYFDRDLEVKAFWQSLPEVVMKRHQRFSTIYYKGSFIRSPLNLADAALKLGPVAVTKIFWSYLHRSRNIREVKSAADWVRLNFGNELYLRFFSVFNEKFWGLQSEELAAEWAGQRIKSSLGVMIWNSLKRDQSFVVRSFDFPVGGSSSICGAQVSILERSQNSSILFNEEPSRIVPTSSGYEVTLRNLGLQKSYSHIIWTGHIDELLAVLLAEQPAELLKAQRLGAQLKFRNLVCLFYVFRRGDLRDCGEHWIDVHDSEIRALRVTNFSNYSSSENSEFASIGMEYNCWHDDDIWSLPDEDLKELGIRELMRMNLLNTHASANNFEVARVPRAYPVYFKGYKQIVHELTQIVNQYPNLILAGRNGLYRWNNMHHSVKTGFLAARNVVGEQNDLAAVKGLVTFGKDTD
jgi:protoporphyrinogen oxidase